jgi:hypothetical protein
MPELFDASFGRMFDKWENKYRKETMRNGYWNLPEWPLFEIGMSEREEKKVLKDAVKNLDNQVRFILMMLSFMQLDGGNSRGNRARMKRFLSIQAVHPKVEGPLYRINFWGGCYSHPVTINLTDFSEFDFGDCWSDCMFQLIEVAAHGFRVWTKKRLDEMMQHLRNDFKNDDYEAKIKRTTGKAGQRTNEVINFEFKVLNP